MLKQEICQQLLGKLKNQIEVYQKPAVASLLFLKSSCSDKLYYFANWIKNKYKPQTKPAAVGMYINLRKLL